MKQSLKQISILINYNYNTEVMSKTQKYIFLFSVYSPNELASIVYHLQWRLAFCTCQNIPSFYSNWKINFIKTENCEFFLPLIGDIDVCSEFIDWNSSGYKKSLEKLPLKATRIRKNTNTPNLFILFFSNSCLLSTCYTFYKSGNSSQRQ